VKLLRWLTLGVALLAASPALPQETCEGFKWDVTREHALFLGTATPLAVGTQEKEAPEVEAGRLYDLALSRASDVTFAFSPSRKKPVPAENAYGGMARFRVPRAGRYRVSLGGHAWVDAAAQHQVLSAADFSGAEGCSAPRKIVAYDFPEGGDVTLEISGAADSHIRMTLTVAPSPGR
jgi:hypothetical protein